MAPIPHRLDTKAAFGLRSAFVGWQIPRWWKRRSRSWSRYGVLRHSAALFGRAATAFPSQSMEFLRRRRPCGLRRGLIVSRRRLRARMSSLRTPRSSLVPPRSRVLHAVRRELLVGNSLLPAVGSLLLAARLLLGAVQRQLRVANSLLACMKSLLAPAARPARGQPSTRHQAPGAPGIEERTRKESHEEDSKGGRQWPSRDSPVPSGSPAGRCW